MLKLDIITPFFGKKEEIISYVKSLNKIKKFNFDVRLIIINDNKYFKLKDLAKLSKFKLSIINNKKNLGPASCRNIGAKKSKSDYLWFLDHDTKINNTDVINKMINYLAFENRKYSTAITGTYEIIEKKKLYLIPVIFENDISIYKIINKKKFHLVANVYDGTNLFLYRKTYFKVGYFDTKLRAYEDYEWSLRSKLKFIYNNNFSILHNEKKKEKKKNNNIYNKYFNNVIDSRNRILEKHKKYKKIFIPLLDPLFFFLIFLCLKVFKTHRSARFYKYSYNYKFSDYIKIWTLLLRSYYKI